MSATAFGPDLSLSADQESLLRTALSSNPRASPMSARANIDRIDNPKIAANGMHTPSDQDVPGFGQLLDQDESPLFEDLDDGNFDWDNGGEQLFGDIPNNDLAEEGDLHDKRKASLDSEDGDEETSKRQEGDGKTPKKPGRKPLTAEPTTKRKAQNRAAQRAFRERKERHLKDLETKVDDLAKASEATNHENGRLRAQVDKLNVELKEYRKRLSLNSTATGHSSPPTATPKSGYQNGNNTDFQFAFPKFGDLPASFLNNGSLARTSSSPQAPTPAATSTTPTTARKESSNSMGSTASTNGSINAPSADGRSWQAANGGFNAISSDFNDLTGLFSPSVLESVSRTNSLDYMNHNGSSSSSTSVKQNSISSNNGANQAHKIPRASSASMTNSPASTMSRGLDSSTGTTPEPSADSPEHQKSPDGGLNTISEESTMQNTFGGKISPPFHRIRSRSGSSRSIEAPHNDKFLDISTTVKSPNINGIDWLAQQNGGQFDPVLFGDYRDPQDNIINSNFDDFFNDAYPLGQDFTSPYNTGYTTAPAHEPKHDLMKEIEIQQSGAEEEVAPAKQPFTQLPCGQLWERVQESEKYKSGEADMDDLCKELKSKAKCSGKGAVIDEKDVDKILGPTTRDKAGDMFKWAN